MTPLLAGFADELQKLAGEAKAPQPLPPIGPPRFTPPPGLKGPKLPSVSAKNGTGSIQARPAVSSPWQRPGTKTAAWGATPKTPKKKKPPKPPKPEDAVKVQKQVRGWSNVG